ncbi:MAG: hypothetical protein ACI9KE_002724 [Polyangiales bacterium]|jgi:hypothetical protein
MGIETGARTAIQELLGAPPGYWRGQGAPPLPPLDRKSERETLLKKAVAYFALYSRTDSSDLLVSWRKSKSMIRSNAFRFDHLGMASLQHRMTW